MLYKKGGIMLKSCKYCGKIHDKKFDCGKKPVYKKHGSETDKFHSSNKWTETAKAVKKRDHYLCQACLHNLDGEGIRYTADTLEVHHIVPISEAWDERLHWCNLITLCRHHHELAERGALDREKLRRVVEL